MTNSANLKAGYAFMLGHPGKEAALHGTGFRAAPVNGVRRGSWTGISWQKKQHSELQNYVRALLHHLSEDTKPSMSLDHELATASSGSMRMTDTRSIFSFVRSF